MRTRMATWTNIGKDVTACMDYRAVLRDAGLDYKVIKKPAKVRIGGRDRRVPGDYYTMRKDESKLYGKVTDKYNIVQNVDAFNFVSYMGDDLIFERAGETAGGMVFIIGKLPDVDILGDRFTPHVIFSNDFKTERSIRAAICPLRIICQNQFSFAFKDANNTVSVRHTRNANERLKEAKIVLKANADYMKQLTTMAEGYARMQVSPRQIDMVLDAMFPVRADDASDKVRKLIREKERFAERFREAYNAPDNYYFRGTAWGLINAYADCMTHDTPQKKRENWEENQFSKVSFGNSEANKFVRNVDMIVA